MTVADTHRAILAIWRIEQARLIAVLARMTREVSLAEELAQEALVAALERWPETGVPDKPGAWLLAAARRRAIDHFRRDRMLQRKHATLAHELEAEQNAMPDLDAALDDDIGDDLLRLIFTACHPLLSREARAALTLRMIGGLTTEEIARAFLASETTIAQRIVRAKRTLSESGLAYETPRGPELALRLASVLEVIYLIFNEGYVATAGDDWMRPQLCEEALRLGRILSLSLTPTEPEDARSSELDGASCFARGGAHEPDGRTDSAAGAESRALGSIADPARTCRLDAGRAVGRRARRLHAAGGNRRATCPGADGSGDRLDTDRRALRRTCVAGALAGRRAQSRGRGGDGGRGAGGARHRRWAGRGAGAQALSTLAQRPRRSPVQARSAQRGAHCVRSRRGAHDQPPRARPHAQARPGSPRPRR